MFIPNMTICISHYQFYSVLCKNHMKLLILHPFASTTTAISCLQAESLKQGFDVCSLNFLTARSLEISNCIFVLVLPSNSYVTQKII